MKTEIRINIDNSDMLKEIFENAYFENGSNGRLSNYSDDKLVIEPTHEFYGILTDLTNMECRITNDDIITGTAKFIIVEKNEDGIYLKPTSLFCIKEDGIYNFY